MTGVIAWIAWFQVANQSGFIVGSFDVVSISAFLPHVNASFFSLLLVVPLVACSGLLLARGKREDTVEVFDARPGSNAARVVGVAWGIMRVCLSCALLSAGITVGIHLTGTYAPFHPGEYLFYLVTLTLPSLVFFTGFTLLVNSAVTNKGIACLVQLSTVALLVFLFDRRYEFIDPFGLALPNTLSRITGHPDLARYLVQRATWLLCGAGCTGIAILLQRRLPDKPGERARTRRVTALLLAGFLGGGWVPLHERHALLEARHRFVATYNKYRESGKLSMTSQETRHEQAGSHVKGRGTLLATNRGEREVYPVILYLNPALRVDKLLVNGAERPFEREHQVIVVRERVPPGETVEIDVAYAGEIDERICYTDVADEEFLATDRQLYHRTGCRYGKRHAYAGERYTLLLPEALWYPVTKPPVNPAMPFAVERDFTRYSLRVKGTGGALPVSQGEREERGDTTIFRAGYPLDGITLCVGDYACASVVLPDSTTCELYLHGGMERVATMQAIVKDTLPKVLARFKETVESAHGRYPFKRFMVVETPVAFTSYYRHPHGGSESLQPEIAFVPESSVNSMVQRCESTLPKLQRARERPNPIRRTPTDEESLAQTLKSTLAYNFSEKVISNAINPNSPVIAAYFTRRAWNGQGSRNNPLDVARLFLHQRGGINAGEYPGLSLLLDATMNKRGNSGLEQNQRNGNIVFLNDYLGKHDFNQALDTLRESELFPDLLNVKAADFRNRLFSRGVSQERWERFYLDFRERHAFQAVSFSRLGTGFHDATGVDLEEVTREVYQASELPAYLFGDFRVERVAEGDGEINSLNRYRFHWKVMNDSDTRGVITLTMLHSLNDNRPFNEQRFSERQFEIGAREARELVLASSLPALGFTVIANTHLSRNVPPIVTATPSFMPDLVEAMPVTRDTSGESFVIDPTPFMVVPDSNEIIVDNDDGGFSVRRVPGFLFPGKREHARVTYQDRYTFPRNPSRHWTRFGGEGLGRGAARSRLFKTTGSGKEEAVWQTRVEKEGIYELFAYLSSNMQDARRIVTTQRVEDNRKKKRKAGEERAYRIPVLHQYYTVSHDGGESSVAVTNDTEEDAWISLGRYRLSPGDHAIRLSDKRDHSMQSLYADAVKWVYTGPPSR
jgi:hypothetical protein